MKKTPQLYDAWNKRKKRIVFSKKREVVKMGEVWRYFVGVNIGTELSKDGRFKRPCLVLKANCWNGLVLVAPITTKYSKYNANHLIHLDEYGKEAYLVLNQIQFIDRKRFTILNKPKSGYNDNFVHKVLLDYSEFLLRDFS